jgi:hypothetical protein
MSEQGDSPLDWIARLGFVARGLLYVLFGAIALVWERRADEGQAAVFQTLTGITGGWLLLAAGTVGLCSYGLFRIVSGWLDLEDKGSDPRGWAGRIAQLGSGAIHLGLAYSALTFLLGWARHRGEANSEETAARTVLTLPLSNLWLYVIAAGFVFAGALQLRKAWKGSHMKQCRHDTPRYVRTLGRIGLVTRGAIFAVIGWSFLEVASTHHADRAQAAGEALTELRGFHGLYSALCIGLILFGVFSLLLARYRIVPNVHLVARTKALVDAD